jgi:Tol biopolymer transport system component
MITMFPVIPHSTAGRRGRLMVNASFFWRRVKDTFQLFVMNRDGSGVRQLTDATGEFTNPHWSPDGTKILCTRRLGNINLIIFAAPN